MPLQHLPRQQMPREQTSQYPTMTMMTPATIRDNPRSLLEDRPEVHHHQRAPNKLSPIPHLLLRNHRHPSGTRDSLMEDLDLPPDQNSTSLAPLESKRKHRKQQKQTRRSNKGA